MTAFVAISSDDPARFRMGMRVEIGVTSELVAKVVGAHGEVSRVGDGKAMIVGGVYVVVRVCVPLRKVRVGCVGLST